MQRNSRNQRAGNTDIFETKPPKNSLLSNKTNRNINRQSIDVSLKNGLKGKQNNDLKQFFTDRKPPVKPFRLNQSIDIASLPSNMKHNNSGKSIETRRMEAEKAIMFTSNITQIDPTISFDAEVANMTKNMKQLNLSLENTLDNYNN